MDFNADGVRISYRIVGTGPSVVLLHGAMIDATTNWTGVVEAAEEHFQLILPDLRGHGASDKPHDRAAYGGELVRDVVRLLDHLRLDAVHVVGYSMGGMLALNLAVHHPDRVRSLLVGGVGWTPPEDMQDGSAFGDALERCESVAAVLDPEGNVYPPEIRRVLDANDRAACAALARGAWQEVVISERALRELRPPLRIVIGGNDPARADVDRLVAVRPTEVVLLPELDHIETMIAPAFAECVTRLLRAATDRVR